MIELLIRAQDAWRPQCVFVFGLDTEDGQPNAVVPLVGIPRWSVGNLSTESRRRRSRIPLPPVGGTFDIETHAEKIRKSSSGRRSPGAGSSAHDLCNGQARVQARKVDFFSGAQDASLHERSRGRELAENLDSSLGQVDQPVDGDTGRGVDSCFPRSTA